MTFEGAGHAIDIQWHFEGSAEGSDPKRAPSKTAGAGVKVSTTGREARLAGSRRRIRHNRLSRKGLRRWLPTLQ
jgi:hypothetical protein